MSFIKESIGRLPGISNKGVLIVSCIFCREMQSYIEFSTVICLLYLQDHIMLVCVIARLEHFLLLYQDETSNSQGKYTEIVITLQNI